MSTDDGTTDEDKVRRLPVRFKEPAPDRLLQVVSDFDRCQHRGPFVIDDALEQVECGVCHTMLSPMFVLQQLAGHEAEWEHVRGRYQDEMKRLNARKRTTCEHCGKMTRISRGKVRE